MKRAFDHCADDYASHRPPYPQEVLDCIIEHGGQPAGRWLADVGAGTGISSRLFAGGGWKVVAVDPSQEMLRRIDSPDATPSSLASPVPPVSPVSPVSPTPPVKSIHPVCAPAEKLPLADASVAVLTVAQAFHWFNPPYALAEFSRVLRPRGLLVLLWNDRDVARSAFVVDFEALIVQYNPKYDREYRRQDWPAKIAAAGQFRSATHRCLHHEWTLTAGGFAGFCRSVSYLRNVVPRSDWRSFEDDLIRLITRHFASGPCVIPLRTDVWTAIRRG